MRHRPCCGRAVAANLGTGRPHCGPLQCPNSSPGGARFRGFFLDTNGVCPDGVGGLTPCWIGHPNKSAVPGGSRLRLHMSPERGCAACCPHDAGAHRNRLTGSFGKEPVAAIKSTPALANGAAYVQPIAACLDDPRKRTSEGRTVRDRCPHVAQIVGMLVGTDDDATNSRVISMRVGGRCVR
jgi:hypothetical protein